MRYPNKINKTICNNKISHSNRGLSLESDLNITNEYYRDNKIAIVYKKPTPVRCVETECIGKKTIIKKAFYEMPSTTDYNGVYKGYYIDFEAKEVRTKAFSLTNIHEHQLKHLFDVREQGGIAFIIVRFSKIDETYMLDSKVLNNIIKNGEKSISLDYFKKNGCLVKTNYHPRLDYINSINTLYFGGKNEHKKNIE